MVFYHYAICHPIYYAVTRVMICIIYLVMEWQQQFNYSYLFDRQMASV